ncbi:MAG: NAD(P)H-hydrate epimerase, partial [Betaproteobacteria bacterium]
MQRIDPLVAEWPLHGPARTRAIERAAQAELPAHALMRRAGLAVARLALALAPHAPRFTVYAGPGNNGGDGVEAALQLQGAGKAVRVQFLGDAARLPGDAIDSHRRAQAAGVPIAAGLAPDAPPGEPVIDALLGLGSSRAPEGEIAGAIDAIDPARGVVLAVDLPSGLDPRTGQRLGDHAVRATHTLALLALEPGLFTGAGRDHAGEVWLDTLGVDASLQAPDAVLAGGPGLWRDDPRQHVQHKGSFGDVHIVGGAAGMVGAVLLAARAAHAAGAGRVYV